MWPDERRVSHPLSDTAVWSFSDVTGNGDAAHEADSPWDVLRAWFERDHRDSTNVPRCSSEYKVLATYFPYSDDTDPDTLQGLVRRDVLLQSPTSKLLVDRDTRRSFTFDAWAESHRCHDDKLIYYQRSAILFGCASENVANCIWQNADKLIAAFFIEWTQQLDAGVAAARLAQNWAHEIGKSVATLDNVVLNLGKLVAIDAVLEAAEKCGVDLDVLTTRSRHATRWIELFTATGRFAGVSQDFQSSGKNGDYVWKNLLSWGACIASFGLRLRSSVEITQTISRFERALHVCIREEWSDDKTLIFGQDDPRVEAAFVQGIVAALANTFEHVWKAELLDEHPSAIIVALWRDSIEILNRLRCPETVRLRADGKSGTPALLEMAHRRINVKQPPLFNKMSIDDSRISAAARKAANESWPTDRYVWVTRFWFQCEWE